MWLDRQKLLHELRKVYSFEKAYSIIQITEEDNHFRNDKVDISISGIDTKCFKIVWI